MVGFSKPIAFVISDEGVYSLFGVDQTSDHAICVATHGWEEPPSNVPPGFLLVSEQPPRGQLRMVNLVSCT